MTIEELKIEADKLGYNIIKKQKPIKLLNCSCGKKPSLWINQYKGNFYWCEECNKRSPYAQSENKAKIAWNFLIKGEQE